MKLTRNLDKITDKSSYVSLISEDNEIRIYYLTDDIVRIRANFNDDFKEKSYSLVSTFYEDELDEFFGNERNRFVPLKYDFYKTNDRYVISGGNLKIEIIESPMTIGVYDSYGDKIYKSINDVGFYEDSNGRIINKFEIKDNDNFYGFGEKSGDINKIMTRMINNPMDSMGYDPKHTDSLYKHIPFYIKLDSDSKKASGFFYHNSFISEFNMGKEKSNYWHRYGSFKADGGDIDLFIINGPMINDVIERYTFLTGRSALLPKKSLGYLASSMYYSELDKDCDKAIEKFVDIAKKEDFPIDGFQLSSGYTNYNTSQGPRRCVLTWDKRRFPAPDNFFKSMDEKGIVVSPNVKPGILTLHPDYKKFKDNNMFLYDPYKKEEYIGNWWGGYGAFIDFTNEKTRDKWKSMLKANLIEMGTASVWNDNCEYDSVFDDDVMCDYEGEEVPITRNRVVMSNIMCKITNDAIKEVYQNTRPFVVCRSGHAGIQRYAQTWAGDNFTSWDSLKYNVATILSMGLSGVSNQGCDIGGFSGSAPSEELFVRWVQNGIFQPRFSIHSASNDNTVTEPWMFDEIKDIVRDAMNLRYALSPYLYSLMYRASECGLPIMQATFSLYQEDPNTYNNGMDFFVGDSLFVSNILEEGQNKHRVYFPGEDEEYYDFYTKEVYRGGQSYDFDVNLESIPIFVKKGSILPISKTKLRNLGNDEVKDLYILIANGKNNEFIMYEDDGKTYNYKNGDYLKTLISLDAGKKTYINFKKEGKYKSSIENIDLEIINKEKSPYFVNIDGKEIEHYLNKRLFDKANEGWYYNNSSRSALIKYANLDKDYEVLISFEEFDLVGM